MSPAQFQAWGLQLLPEWGEKKLILLAPNPYLADLIHARFLSMIARAVKEVMGQEYSVCIMHKQAGSGEHNEIDKSSPPAILLPGNCSLGNNREKDDKPRPPLIDHVDNALFSSGAEGAFSMLSSSLSADRSSMHTKKDICPSSLPCPRPLPEPRPLPQMQLALPVKQNGPNQRLSDQSWRFCFDDFVVGPCNQLAYAASRSMCEDMLHTDILYLSSATGLGKTHLMQAVGKALCTCCNRKAMKVEYLMAEEFANQFYQALKTQTMDSFKARCRSADLFLFEDVHFLQGKEKMQAELLATVNALSERGSKVVFTSSFVPRDLKQLDEQLQSRLSSGLLAVIERPDEPMRRKILRHKAASQHVTLPEEVEDALAKHINTDVRQIESCLQNLILKARLLNTKITLQMAFEVMSHYAALNPILDMETIVAFVCRAFGINREQLLSSCRKQEYVQARNTAFFLARKHTDLSLEAIGRQFNRRHSTVLKGITSLEREISTQSPLGRQLSNTISMIEKNGNILG